MHSKTGVSTEDNPAYGVSLNTPQPYIRHLQLYKKRLCMSKFQSSIHPSGEVDLVV